MDTPPNPLGLKYLSRSPLPLERVAGHLCVKIIEKQSVASMFNLPYTNSRYGALVETALSHNPNVAIIRPVLEKYNKKALFSSDRIQELFPPTEYMNHGPNISLDYWIFDLHFFGYNSCKMDRNRKFAKKIMSRVKPLDNMHIRHISELWEKQQRRGPNRVPLQSLPDEMWRGILRKATAVSVTRLARCGATVTASFDGYVQAVLPVRILLESVDFLPGEDNNEHYCMFRDFHVYPLIETAFTNVLGHYSRPLTPEEETAIEEMNRTRRWREKIWENYEYEELRYVTPLSIYYILKHWDQD